MIPQRQTSFHKCEGINFCSLKLHRVRHCAVAAPGIRCAHFPGALKSIRAVMGPLLPSSRRAAVPPQEPCPPLLLMWRRPFSSRSRIWLAVVKG